MRESPNQPFSVSPPGQEAYARSCSIAGRASRDSLWARHGGILWRLFDTEVGNPSAPLFPIHDTCIAMVRIIAKNHASSGLPCTKNFASLEEYYNALTRLFERLTEWPSEQPELIAQLEQVGGSPTGYGSEKLEWEHGSYGWDLGSPVDWIETDSEVSGESPLRKIHRVYLPSNISSGFAQIRLYRIPRRTY